MQHPTLTLICLPYAGGNRHSYRLYNDLFPGYIKLITLDYPGHGARMQEDPLTDLRQIALDAYAQVSPLLDKPYAIYGHSMGASVGYLLAKEIQRQQKPLPVQLIFTGSEAPSVPCPHAGKHLLSQADFFQSLKEMGGMPEEVLRHQELLAFFEPVLRADFQAISDYRHKPGIPLNIPLTIMAGTTEGISAADIAPWQEETLHPIRTRYFEGGHFFILEHTREVVAECMLTLQKTILSI